MFNARKVNPLRAKRAMISATNPRWTPSGLHRERTRVIRQSLYRVRARGSVV